jgi:hypothetical protein
MILIFIPRVSDFSMGGFGFCFGIGYRDAARARQRQLSRGMREIEIGRQFQILADR